MKTETGSRNQSTATEPGTQSKKKRHRTWAGTLVRWSSLALSLQASLPSSIKFTKSSDNHNPTQPSGEPCKVETALVTMTKHLKTISEKLSLVHPFNIYKVLAVHQKINTAFLTQGLSTYLLQYIDS